MEITIDNDVPMPSNKRVAMPTKEVAKPARASEKRVRIMLEESDEIPPTGQFFSVNDHAYILRPGEEADVPEELVEVLDNAIQEMPIMQGDKIMGFRKRLRFPYRILARDIN